MMRQTDFRLLMVWPVYLLAAAFFFMTWQPLQAQTPKLQVRGKLQYVHGVNVGWFFGRYSTDIGLNPVHPEWGTGYDSATADRWLTDIKQMNVNVVRLWLFESLEGLTFDTDGYVNGLEPTFLKNLDDLIGKANRLGLAYELVLMNHALDLDIGQTLPNAAKVKNMVVDGTARQKFLTAAVKPLVVRYNNNPGVFSYDVMNESDLAVMRGVCTRPELRTFVQQTALQINSVNAAIQVTCSSAFYKFLTQAEHNSWFGGLGLDFYENHNYGTAPNLPVVPAWLDKPMLLGEYGPTLPAPNYNGQAWPAADQNAAAAAHIVQAKDRGWAGAMAWMYWHSAGNGESLVLIPGGSRNWESSAFTIEAWGKKFFSPPTARSVYAEGLASGWSNWSWNTNVNLTSTDRAFAGTRSLRATSTGAFSGVSLRNDAALSTAGYSKLSFSIYTPTTPRKFQVYLQPTDAGTASPVYAVTTTANTWTPVVVSLSQFGSPAAIQRITIQSNSATAIGNHWLDNVQLQP